jgi:hypothetical protein
MKLIRRNNNRHIGGEMKIWTIGLYVKEDLRRSQQKEETISRQISLRYPSTVRLDRSRMRFTFVDRRWKILMRV